MSSRWKNEKNKQLASLASLLLAGITVAAYIIGGWPASITALLLYIAIYIIYIEAWITDYMEAKKK